MPFGSPSVRRRRNPEFWPRVAMAPRILREATTIFCCSELLSFCNTHKCGREWSDHTIPLVRRIQDFRTAQRTILEQRFSSRGMRVRNRRRAPSAPLSQAVPLSTQSGANFCPHFRQFRTSASGHCNPTAGARREKWKPVFRNTCALHFEIDNLFRV